MNAPPTGYPSLNTKPIFSVMPSQVNYSSIYPLHKFISVYEDTSVFYYIHDVFVSSGLASANMPRSNEQQSAQS